MTSDWRDEAPDWWADAESEIYDAIDNFSSRLKEKIEELDPKKVIRRKNPFLFCARSSNEVDDLAEMILNAFLSSSEETMFGNVLEEIALIVCQKAKNGRKSGIPNIDLEFDDGNVRTIVQVKSGANWANTSQKKKLAADFQTAVKTLRQGNTNISVRCIEGISYGKSKITDYGGHERLQGLNFWQEISDWEYTPFAVIDVIRGHAGNGMSEIQESALEKIVQHLRDEKIVVEDNKIDWDRFLEIVLR